MDGGTQQTYEDTDFIGGSTRIYLSTKGVYQGADGKVAGVFGIARDITKRRQAEDAVRERERQLQTVTDNVPLLIARLDRDCRYLFANRAYFDWLRIPLADVLGRPMWEVIGEAAYAVVRPYIERTLAGERLEYDALLQYRTIGARFMHVSYFPERGPEGEVTGFVLSAMDVTERLRIEEALQESQRTLEALIANVPGMVYRCRNDRDWTMEFVSEGCASLTGYTPEELISGGVVPYAALIHADDREAVRREVETAMRRNALPPRLSDRHAFRGPEVGLGAGERLLLRARRSALPGGLRHRHHRAACRRGGAAGADRGAGERPCDPPTPGLLEGPGFDLPGLQCPVCPRRGPVHIG